MSCSEVLLFPLRPCMNSQLQEHVTIVRAYFGVYVFIVCMCVPGYLYCVFLTSQQCKCSICCLTQAVTNVEKLASRPSDPLVLVWPGVLPPALQQASPTTANTVKIEWDAPYTTEGVKIKQLKVGLNQQRFFKNDLGLRNNIVFGYMTIFRVYDKLLSNKISYLSFPSCYRMYEINLFN